VPCLFDDGEIYEMRALDAPPDLPTLQANVQLNALSAETVAELVKQYLTSQAKPKVAPAVKDRKKPQNAQVQQADQQESQLQAVQKFTEYITPDKFIGKTLNDIPKVVTQIIIDLKGSSDNSINSTVLTRIQMWVESLVFKSAVNSLATASKFDRPDDVVCSFSVLQWHETSDNFGRRVANHYVALQVTVRNLNTQNEFIVHDIQIAVDTGLNRAQFGRFEAARDKLVVRNVAQRGQSEDPRNRIINILQAVGAIAGGASTAVTQGLSDTVEATDMASAVAIFQGPFMTGLINIFPDHTIEHINHINDLAFSASSTSKTIVPIQGSVPLVTFLSEKPLEQLPFARCGTSVPKRLWYTFYTHTSADDSANSDSPGSSRYQFCMGDAYDAYGNPISPDTTENTRPEYYMKPYPFKKWEGAALDVLKHRIFVVVGGVHIKEVAKQPTLSSISCAPGNDTTIDLSKITGPNATCTLKGADLDLVSQVSLQNATDSNDKTQVQGTSSVSGDTTQAEILFLKSDLAKLKGTTYKLYYALKGGGPQSTSLTVTVKGVVSLNPSSLDFGNQVKGKESDPKSVVVTNNGDVPRTLVTAVTGANAADYHIKTNTCVSTPVKPIAAGGNCTISLTFTAIGTAAETATLSITDDAPGSPHTVELTGTGTAAAAAGDGH
jgi:hypothetical protein